MQRRRVYIGVLLVFSAAWFSLDAASGEDNMKTKAVGLPKPALKGDISIEEVIEKRRSIRSYSEKELTDEQLSQLLWAAQGITDTRGLRAAPSAGALYPLEIYVVKKDGLFHYSPDGHKLEPISDKDLRPGLAKAALGQGFVAQAPVDIIICAVYKRIQSRYGDRGVRYTDIEVGHAAENVHLQAVALGLGSVPVGAFSDDAVSSLLGLSKEETPVYIIPVGYKK
ncbi:MAG: SagB/ThcOx family dehydrogenase [Candidatus Omnitrophica bacterium]|nr:SagB/ThcOx family dehydrogenase [Candidatus Omnitrophota bacterium]